MSNDWKRAGSLLWLVHIVCTGLSEWALCCHGDVGVGVLGLGAEGLVEAVAWRMRIELGVHVPA